MKKTAAHYEGTDRLTAEGRHELSDSEKRELARRILQKAKEFGVEVHSENVLHWAK